MQLQEPCQGTNGKNMQDCTVTRHKDQNPLCSGKAGEEIGRNCVPGHIPAVVAAQLEGVCDGNNGMAGQDCRVSRHKDQKPHCTGKPNEEPGINCVDPYLMPAANSTTTAETSTTETPSLIQMYEPVVGGSGMSLPICTGLNSGKCEEIVDSQKGANNAGGNNISSLVDTGYYLPTCTDRDSVNCQPTCTESLTRGCTEAASPNWPERDRFEGKYTHK
jgi:hypothetical protein